MPRLNAPGGPLEAALLVFDKDGVLADFERAWGAVVRARVDALTHLAGAPELAPALKKRFGVDDAWRALPHGLLATGTRKQAIAAATACLAEAGRTGATAIAEAAFAHADASVPIAERHAPLPGVSRTLARLHAVGWKLAIASTDTTAGIQRFLAHNGLTEGFVALVGADRVARAKPASEMFELACREAGVPPSQALMIGDSVVDLQMGRAAGARATIGVLGGVGTHDLLAPLADWLLPDVTALAP